MQKYSSQRRLDALDVLGGACVHCGGVEDLEIHHIDPATKSFTIAAGWHHSWAKILQELQKCQILCRDCHRDHHRVVNPHGSVRRYWQGCRCDACKAKMSAYNKEKRLERLRRFDSAESA